MSIALVRKLRFMIRIAISAEAYAAIAGSAAAGATQSAANGDFFVWLEPGIVNRLRGRGESYRDVIMRLAAGEAG